MTEKEYLNNVLKCLQQEKNQEQAATIKSAEKRSELLTQSEKKFRDNNVLSRLTNENLNNIKEVVIFDHNNNGNSKR